MLGPSYHAAVSKDDSGHSRIVKPFGVAVKGLSAGFEGGSASCQGNEEELGEKRKLEILLVKNESKQSLGGSSLHPGDSMAIGAGRICCHGLCNSQ